MKQTVYRYEYSGDRIRCVKVSRETVSPRTWYRDNAHWIVIVAAVVLVLKVLL